MQTIQKIIKHPATLVVGALVIGGCLGIAYVAKAPAKLRQWLSKLPGTK